MEVHEISIETSRLTRNLMKMGTTPFCGVFACVTVEYSKKALSSDVVKVNDERISIFHRSSCPLVFGYADLVCGVFSRMSVQNLRNGGE